MDEHPVVNRCVLLSEPWETAVESSFTRVNSLWAFTSHLRNIGLTFEPLKDPSDIHEEKGREGIGRGGMDMTVVLRCEKTYCSYTCSFEGDFFGQNLFSSFYLCLIKGNEHFPRTR